ncbi:MAG TPA: hypothetical protein VD905_04450 [Flavobacteriales bacterium]|nr:hypothetical protein [Flavobacteriales bacterium]
MIDFTIILKSQPGGIAPEQFMNAYNGYTYKTHVKTDFIEAGGLHLPHYPVTTFEMGKYKVIFEGAIYNLDEEQIKQKLEILLMDDTMKTHLRIREFQLAADGEFNFYILEPSGDNFNRFIFFNDALGRLQTYHCATETLFCLSRNAAQVLKLQTNARVNMNFVADTLVFGFPLDNKMIFDNVVPSSEGQIIELARNTVSGQLELKTGSITVNLGSQKKFNSKEEYIEHIQPLLRQSTTNRLSYIGSAPFCCDLTGGFDSRTVFGLIHTTANAIYTTNINLGDETETVNSLLREFNCLDKLKVIPAEPYPENENFNRLLYYLQHFTGNNYSNGVCWQALESQKKLLNIKNRIAGIGFTDFIRKGIRNDRKSLSETFSRFNPYGLTIPEAATLLNINKGDYVAHIDKTVGSWPEKNNRDIHKKYFYLRTLILQSRLTEDRERFHYWNIHPLWNHQLCFDTLQFFNLNWRGYHVHYLLLKSIHPSLVKVPINKSYLDFENERMLRMIDFKENNRLYRALKKRVKNITQKKTGPAKFNNIISADFFANENSRSGNPELDYLKKSFVYLTH